MAVLPSTTSVGELVGDGIPDSPELGGGVGTPESPEVDGDRAAGALGAVAGVGPGCVGDGVPGTEAEAAVLGGCGVFGPEGSDCRDS